MKENFYADLKEFSSFEELEISDGFVQAPDDWIVALTDVRGSTKAIEQGYYKEVNTVGVGVIIAVKNVCDDIPLPFVFGGDGATILFPSQYRNQVEEELQKLRAKAQSQFGFDLRCALIPVKTVHDLGVRILVGKIELSKGNFLAVFSGGGLSVAEELAKGPTANAYLVSDKSQNGHPDLTGLECRWNPIQAKQKSFLSLIVISRNKNAKESRGYYRELTARINRIVPINYLVKPEIMDLSWPPKHLGVEARAKFENIVLQKLFTLVLQVLSFLFIFLIKRMRGKQGDNAVKSYLSSLEKNTDHFKVDDALRMILDVSDVQKKELIQMLEEEFGAGKIYYGYHSSKEAIMTCFVRSLTDHIHFVDGGDGGYCLAAKMLKSQKLSQA